MISSNEALATCSAVGAHGSHAAACLNSASESPSALEPDIREGSSTSETAGERYSRVGGVGVSARDGRGEPRFARLESLTRTPADAEADADANGEPLPLPLPTSTGRTSTERTPSPEIGDTGASPGPGPGPGTPSE